MRGNSRHGIVVQERDRRLLTELAVMRVADREQAKVVAGFGSNTRANTRLLALTRAGLLRRFFLGIVGGSRKAVYALSGTGATLVGAAPRGPRRPRDELLIADFFVLHQLAVNDVYCELKRPAADVSLARWLSFHEPLAQNLRLIPDGYCELKTPAGTIAAFLEVDIGHERLAVWAGKIRRYIQFALSGDYERRFGQSQFRVLVVANSERRLRSIRKVVSESTQRIFWFATFESIGARGFFGPVWLRPNGEEGQALFATGQDSS